MSTAGANQSRLPSMPSLTPPPETAPRRTKRKPARRRSARQAPPAGSDADRGPVGHEGIHRVRRNGGPLARHELAPLVEHQHRLADLHGDGHEPGPDLASRLEEADRAWLAGVERLAHRDEPRGERADRVATARAEGAL